MFDITAAINVCRDAGFFEFALELAKLRKAHGWYVRLLIEDFSRHEDALEYIYELDVHFPPYFSFAWASI